MPDTPLNPDGVLHAMDTLMAETDTDERATEWAHKVTTRVLEGYFAVAQPEVNSVEELDALPAGTLVKSGGREFYKTSYVDLPWILPYGVDRFGSSYLAKHSKVTVIHRPEVKP